MSDDLLKHEALDRCNVLLATLNDHLLEHPFVQGNPQILYAAQCASDSLSALYQLIGGVSELDIPPMSSKGGDWIPWFGGDCPVAWTALVEYIMRDGECGEPEGHLAGDLIWTHCGGSYDIVAYRVVSEATS